jgi:feruloyl esterase
VSWVEEGKAPDTIMGPAFADGNGQYHGNGAGNIGTEVDFKRRHCMYPFRNVYTGQGGLKDPDSWECIV